MIRNSQLLVSVVFAIMFVMPVTNANGQSRRNPTLKTVSRKKDNSDRTSSKRTSVQERTRRSTAIDRQIDPDDYQHACYKTEAAFLANEAARGFVNSGAQWDQPGGVGQPITLTYSYSNLLDGSVRGLNVEQLRAATEEAMSIWADVVPINFVEVADTGPDPTAAENDYSAGDSAQIRIGAHVLDGVSGGELAHAYLPYSNSSGLAGDLHFDIDEDWGINDGGFFLETVLHELGHILGLDHETSVDAIMNPVIKNRFVGLGTGYLLEDDIAGIREVYGAGFGSVAPLLETLADPENPGDTPSDQTPTDEPADDPVDGPMDDPVDEPMDDPMDEPADDPMNDPTDEPADDPVDDPSEDPTGSPQTPSNNVVSEFDTETGLMVLRGDSENNSLFVFGSRWVTVVLGYGGTTIDEETGKLWIHQHALSLEMVLSEGEDQALLFGVSANDVSVDFGLGDDLFVSLLSRIESLVADGGEGNDMAVLLFNRIGSLTDSAFESLGN